MALVSFVGDRLGPPVEQLDFDGIQRARAATLPRNRVTDLVTGGVDQAVGITYGTAPARDEHEIPLRLYRPRALRDSRTDVPVVMWFHGGGWVLGNVVGYDPVCSFIAAEVGCVVVSVDYRMAPEHRAPVAVEDCVDATTWVRDHGDTRLRHQALIYPATDLTMASPSIREHTNAPGLTKRSMDAFRDHYVP